MPRAIWLAALAASISLAAAGQEAAKPETTSAALAKRAASLTMSWPDHPQRKAPSLLTAPVLRCNDLTRDEVDGAVWLWLDDKRPIAAMCLLQFASGKWNYELVSLNHESMKVAGSAAWTWEPKATPRTWIALESAVPENSRARQQTLRTLARRSAASERHRGESFVLRLLERPLYTYADEANGILEGAVFALTNGTNPEILLQLEAQGDKTKKWRAAFSRLGSAALQVKLEDQEVWSAPAVDARDPREPYFGVNELP
jgi:hypothetical protein